MLAFIIMFVLPVFLLVIAHDFYASRKSKASDKNEAAYFFDPKTNKLKLKEGFSDDQVDPSGVGSSFAYVGNDIDDIANDDDHVVTNDGQHLSKRDARLKAKHDAKVAEREKKREAKRIKREEKARRKRFSVFSNESDELLDSLYAELARESVEKMYERENESDRSTSDSGDSIYGYDHPVDLSDGQPFSDAEMSAQALVDQLESGDVEAGYGLNSAPYGVEDNHSQNPDLSDEDNIGVGKNAGYEKI